MHLQLTAVLAPLVTALSTALTLPAADPVMIDAERHHLRTTGRAEWTRFAGEAEDNTLRMTFMLENTPTDSTLLIRQTDVRLRWDVSINGTPVGRLQQDENDLVHAISVSADVLRPGSNEILVAGTGDVADDVQIGPIRLLTRPMQTSLSDAVVTVNVTDNPTGTAIPCRLTIVDRNGSLFPVAAESSETLAVRTGVIYTSDGTASFGLAAGQYKIFAGRGFEYSRDLVELSIEPGQTISEQLSIQRQVDTAGWVACDTHVHTITHSGHGDATITERMVTLAGEGIEMPVATDHNKQIDYQPDAQRQNVRQYFTPVIGNEVTTNFGHFNAFPFRAGVPTPDHDQTDWDVLLPAIFAAPDIEVVILNHGRDVHRNYRPLDPENYNEASGDSLNGRVFRFNAMETLNSGAQQTDPLELFRDWITLTNRGLRITPIGSSDSHDVNRYIVGQGRTYIRASDDDPSRIDIAAASRSMRDGHVIVSAGLFVSATVNDRFGPGDLASTDSSEITVDYSVRCPDWITPSTVSLYQNGIRIKEQELRTAADRDGTWTIPRPPHDVFLTVLAVGPGVSHPSWPFAQPYQPDSPTWSPTVLSFTGAISIDVDGDGSFTSARGLAQHLVNKSGKSFTKLLDSLASYDEAVAIQAAALWQTEHASLMEEPAGSQWSNAAPATRAGFSRYLQAWRDSQLAQLQSSSN